MTKIDLGVSSRHSHAFNKHGRTRKLGFWGLGDEVGTSYGETWEAEGRGPGLLCAHKKVSFFF